MQTVTSKPYKMLSLQSFEPREAMVLLNPTWKEVDKLITNGLHAIDLETTGLDPQNNSILGVGLANDRYVFYIDLAKTDYAFEQSLWLRLTQVPLVAHNTNFDLSFLEEQTGMEYNFIGCSLVLFKMLSTEGWPGQRWGLDVAISDILGWPESNKETLEELLRKHKLPKARMFELAELEPYAFGEYCALDAEACWQLWGYLVGVCKDPQLAPILVWHQQEFLNEINLLIEQQSHGLELDDLKLKIYREKLSVRLVRISREFLTHPLVKGYVDAYNEACVEQIRAAQPAQRTKTGKLAVRWIKWQQKLVAAKETQHFNIQSKDQLAKLFYSHIYETWIEDGKLQIQVGDEVVTAELTATGKPPVYKKLLPRLGEPGRLLAEYNKIQKEQSYVDACLTKLSSTSVLHPTFRVHGTVTGRLGGSGGLNLQQQPKTRGYLECWKARPGHKLVQLDFSAIEPVVLTNATKDDTLMKLYGPNAKPNDVYLFVAAHTNAFAEQILEHYHPDSPTPESIAAAKKHCKKIRAACKTVHLAKQYGASKGKIFHTLREAGFPMEFEDVAQLCDDWDRLFGGTKKFHNKLLSEWKARGGWFYNLLRRPLATDDDKKKDLVNTYCQSTGHDLLLKYLCHVEILRTEYNVEMYPWIVDYHDESIWEAPEKEVERTQWVLEQALINLNKELKSFLIVPIKGQVEIADTLADIKCEE